MPWANSALRSPVPPGDGMPLGLIRYPEAQLRCGGRVSQHSDSIGAIALLSLSLYLCG